MANPEHVEIVIRGADTIRNWRSSHPDLRLDLSGAVLKGINLEGANLVNVDFRGADLSKACLSNTFIQDTDFENATLNHVLFNRAILSDVNFSNAHLENAFFAHANITGTDFISANLTDASFFSATIRFSLFQHSNLCGVSLAYTTIQGGGFIGADFRNVIFNYSSLQDVDLSLLSGLDRIKHFGPSSIGVDTLLRSNGKVPEIFLRGCGLSDDFISNIPRIFSIPDYYSCFISYSHEDKAFAHRLYDALQGRGIRCWLDEHQILPGDNIYERIDHGIRVWDKVLLCASRHSLTSGWVDDELKHAFAKEKQLFKDRGCEVLSLIPLNLDSYIFSNWNHPKKNQVLERMAPDFTGWESDNTKFEQQLERVVKALQTNNTGREPEPPSKL